MCNNNVEIERQTLSGGLVGHGQALDLLAVFEREAIRPHLVRPRGLGATGPRPARSGPRAFLLRANEVIEDFR
jgi:hypothetical protein